MSGIDQLKRGQARIRELVGAGFLHRHGRIVTPTRAALYFRRLAMD